MALLDVLNAVPLIPDPKMRAAVHERIRPLVFGLPPSLVSEAKAGGGVGRYVRIDLPHKGPLTLAEVQVLKDGENIALAGKANQSSTAYGGEAGRAIDGNLSGKFGDGGQTHTSEFDQKPWWELDLGAERPIDSIIVFGRTEDGNRYRRRLDRFKLSVLDEGRKPVFVKANNPATDDSRFELPPTWPGDSAGRHASPSCDRYG